VVDVILSEQTIIDALNKLDRGWPKDLWLFAASGQLVLMKTKDGERVYLPNGGVDPAYEVMPFPGIACDGGDW
jgi:hypothetical protein